MEYFNLIDNTTRKEPYIYPAIKINNEKWFIKIGNDFRFAIPAKLRSKGLMAFEANIPELKEKLHRRSGYVHVHVDEIEERKPISGVHFLDFDKSSFKSAPFKLKKQFPKGLIQELEILEEIKKEIEYNNYKLTLKETREIKDFGDIGILKDDKLICIVDSIGLYPSKDDKLTKRLVTEYKNTFKKFEDLNKMNVILTYAFPLFNNELKEPYIFFRRGYKITSYRTNFTYLIINEESLKDFFINERTNKRKEYSICIKPEQYKNINLLTIRAFLKKISALL